MKFLAPILQSVLSGAAKVGIEQLMTPKPQQPGMQSAPQPGLIPGVPPGVAGSGTTNSPQGSLNFSGGYTGSPLAGGPSGVPSTGFTTMGSPVTDQSKLKRGLTGNGFSAI